MVQFWRGARRQLLVALLAVGSVIAVGQSPALGATPVARPDAYSTPAGTPLNVGSPGVLANDSDPDGHPLRVGMHGEPRYGSLSISTNGSFTYTPAAGFTGNDTFTYMAHDPDDAMGGTTVTITVGSGGGGGGQLPTLSVNNKSVTEGAAGTTRVAVFVIKRSGDTSGTSTVKYSTANGTATAGSDYTAIASKTLTFPAGVAVKKVKVKVVGDNVREANETFTLNLSSPTGATISDGTGVGTIVNDD